MKINDRNTHATTKPRLSLVSGLSLLTALAATVGAMLHLMGDATHTARLGHLGVDAGLFPKATDWMLLAGYSSAFDRGIAILKLMDANVLWSLLVFLILSFFLALLRSSLNFGSRKPPVWLEQQSERVQQFICNSLSSLLFGCAVYFLFVALLALMAVPAALGASAGKAAAERELVEYAKGCGKTISHCVRLKKGNEIIGTGFVVDSSPTHIAIFDVSQRQARSMSREGIETVAMRAPQVQP